MQDHIAQQIKSGEIQTVEQLIGAHNAHNRIAAKKLHPASAIYQGIALKAEATYLESKK